MVEYVQFELGGKTVRMETGRLARQASGAVQVTCEDTVLLGTVVGSASPRTDMDFFPLTCDYEERFYAVGKIPGSFPRREGRPGEKGILISRMIDRPIRPLFPKGYRNEVQVMVLPLSSDQIFPPDVLAVNAASAALTISDIPFDGPVGCVRVGLIGDETLLNPTYDQIANSDLDLIVVGTKSAVIMVEAGANEVPEEKIVQAINFAHQQIVMICQQQELLREKAGKPKRTAQVFQLNPELLAAMRDAAADRIRQAIRSSDKQTRETGVDAVKAEVLPQLAERFPEDAAYLKLAWDQVETEVVRQLILVDKIRVDGRQPDEIREITCEVGVLPRAHGSAVFTRGQTQVLNAVALGALSEAQIIDTLAPQRTKRYIHHYNFPAFSVGEARQARGPGRREIGHGALAERALLSMIPPEPAFPYTIRLVSDVLESNGSSSMASTCASTLSLMDAGVPIKAPVAGIAMGLVSNDDNSQYTVLTDIQGIEDHCGDMDFKVAGTPNGITALQMDLKSTGISEQILRDALTQAREARLFILEKMLAALPEPRQALSNHAPRVFVVHINPEKIGEIIGPGGKTIKRIQAETGAKIDIEQDGTVYIASSDAAGGQRAFDFVQGMTREAEIGTVYEGKVTGIQTFGAFLEILPGKEGLLHLSQMNPELREEGAIKLGDPITVKVIGVDDGKIRLSQRALSPDFDMAAETQDRGGRGRGGGGSRGGGRDRGGDRGADRDRGDRDRGDRDRGGDRGGARGGDRDSGGDRGPARIGRVQSESKDRAIGATFRPRDQR